VSDWQPIETAPKDKDVEVLLRWNDDVIRIGKRWADLPGAFKVMVDFGDCYAGVYSPKDYEPTHWMPLPPPPKTEPSP